MNTEKSRHLFHQAQAVIPGGVNSPVRAFKSVDSEPLFIKKALGAHVWDADGNRFCDYVGSWGPAVVGHTHPEVVKAVQEVAANGLSFGAPTELETNLAQTLVSALPCVDMVRFVSSGTEACMSAIRLARAFTGKDKIIKFNGHYHGHADTLLVQAGSGVATLGIPGSPGVPKGTVADTLSLPFNDFEAIEQAFKDHAGQIAAVIFEPIAGNAGFIRPKEGFTEHLRQLCDQNESLLICDEVMTGFRVAWGGAQTLLNFKPDISTFGKVIGGGMPLAAYAGRKEIMSHVAPHGSMYQAGTLSGNPLAVTAGIKTLEILQRPQTYSKLEKLTKALTEGLQEIGKKLNIPIQVDCQGGMFGLFFSSHSVNCFEDAQKSNILLFQKFFRHMLARGIYLAPSPFEAGFVSLAHSMEDIAETLERAEESLRDLSDDR